MRLLLDHYYSAVAPLLIVTDELGRLRAMEFADLESRMTRLLRQHYGECTILESPAPRSLIAALDAYFGGDLNAIDGIPTATGGSDFQRAVWKALRAIPAGSTTSYSELARTIGRAGAARAVGAANGANPIPIVVPCHRVIGADGSLTGFASGLPRKTWLLQHEARHVAGSARDAGLFEMTC
jgi:O-6-methylguanine DNA methyltransferase